MKTLHIKNMVCNRCIFVIKKELNAKGLQVKKIELGKVELLNDLTDLEIDDVSSILIKNGFELIEDRKSKIIDTIKLEIDNYIALDKSFPHSIDSLSKYLTNKIGYEYSYISSLFSSTEGITIEKFFIHRKIDRIKELLVYDELTLGEIAFRMGYSSTQYLSNQFKKITGLTASHFKKIKDLKQK